MENAKKGRLKRLAKTQVMLGRLKKLSSEPVEVREKRLNEERESSILRRDEDKYFGNAALLSFKSKLREMSKKFNSVDPKAGSERDMTGQRPKSPSGSPSAFKKESGIVSLPPTPDSPRSEYIREVVRTSILPLPLFLRKDGNPRSINFANRGLGDAKIMAVLHVIDKLPAVAEINFRDNRLTDTALTVLTTKLEKLKMLTHLDLSYNDIDDSAKDIMDYLVSKKCTLVTLVMDGADVDDVECAHIAEAMKHNSSIHSLSLSHNKIGEMELLNVVKPDLITGGEGMGDMLMHNATLTELDLSWNSIRMESAITLADALAHNQTLLTLKLAHNTFADMAAQRIGHALRSNTSLKTLDLSFNGLVPKSSATLAYNLIFNTSLVSLTMDGNKLGTVGAQGVVGAMQRSEGEDRHLYISFRDTHTRLVDKTVFDPKQPNGVWEVDLTEPYGRMIVEECMYLANNKAGCRMTRLEYNGKNVPLESKDEEVKADDKAHFSSHEFLRQAKDFVRILNVDHNRLTAAGVLKPMLESFSFKLHKELLTNVVDRIGNNWAATVKKATDRGTLEELPALEDVLLMEFFEALFQIGDDDESGLVDIDELMAIMAEIEVPVDRFKAARMMRDFDVDDSGTIDSDEFSMAMVKEFCNMDAPKKLVVEKATGQPWLIPEKGKLKITVASECANPASGDVPDEDSIDRVIHSMKNAGSPEEREAIFENACRSPYYFLTTHHAQMIFDEVASHTEDILSIIPPLLPQMVSAQHALRFIDSNFNDAGKLAIRVKMGPIFCAYMGNSTGHYNLDLKHMQNRIAGQKLAAQSRSMEQLCEHMNVHTSQKGNHSTFRNECLEDVSISTPTKWWSSPPDAGKIAFDFAATDRPAEGSRSISDSRFRSLVSKLDLKSIAPLHEVLAERDRVEREKKAVLAEERRKRRARQKQAELALRRKEMAKAAKRAAESKAHIDANLESVLDSKGGSLGISPIASPTGSRPGTGFASGRSSPGSPGFSEDEGSLNTGGFEDEDSLVDIDDESMVDSVEAVELVKQSAIPDVISSAHIRQYFSNYMESSYHYYDYYPRERMRDMSRPGYDPNASRPSTPEDMQYDPPAEHRHKSKFSVIFPFAYYKLLQLQITLPSIYLSVQQVIDLMDLFPSDDFVRVQVFISCFSRIVDLKNIHRIVYDVNIMSLDERLETEHRLGILNLFNPSEPNREFRLDLRRWDHRQMSRHLIRLAQEEPGDNWDGATYRWAKYDLPVPGWVLPATWLLPDGTNIPPDGPRTHGWLCVTYTSTGPGCQPNHNARRRMRAKLLTGLKKIV
jgi:Ca2+-binding EF-hand superfamily protein/Leucine-rich repeat (LRR) protein